MYIIIILFINILLLSFFLSYVKSKSFLHPNTLYTLLWSGVSLISYFNFIDLKTPSKEVYIYILISIVVFNLTFLSICKKSIQKNKMYLLEKIEDYEINYDLIIAINVVFIIIMMPLFLRGIMKIITTGEFGLRSEVLSIIGAGSGVKREISLFIRRTSFMGVLKATSIITAVDMVRGRYKLLKVCLLGQIMYIIIFGGRIVVMDFILAYIISYLLLKNVRKNKIKKRYIAFVIIALIAITTLRGNNKYTLLESLVLYYTGSLSYLEIIISNPMAFGLDKLLYGKLTFGFLLEPIIIILNNIFMFNVKNPSFEFDRYAQNFVNIGGNGVSSYYNNNTTILYIFLRDFGVWGIVVGTFLLAMVIAFLQNKYIYKGNPKYLYFIVFFYTTICSSTMSYNLKSSVGAIIFIIFLFSVKKKEDKMQKIGIGRKYQ